MTTTEVTRVCVVGGAGFIGSHFVGRLLGDPAVEAVIVYDNFSSGREWHLAEHLTDPRLRVVRGDVGDLDLLIDAMRGSETVIHLASNPDIRGQRQSPRSISTKERGSPIR